MNLKESFKNLSPSLTFKVWGHERFSKLKNLEGDQVTSQPLGETWEVSVHKDGSSKIGDQKLSDLISEEQMPYLVKLIDTNDYLSVQVHPGDEYAKKHENSLGKTECWVILGAEDGAGIYLGMKEGVTKEEFEAGLKAGEDMSNFLQFHEVNTGNFFFVPAGSIHAIGKGVFLAEVQQSSGITYRVWDWNRVDENGVGRELHVEKAMDVINFDPAANTPEFFKFNPNIFSFGKKVEVVEHPQFKLSSLKLGGGESFNYDPKGTGRPISILCLTGIIKIGGTFIDAYSAALWDNENNESFTIECMEAGEFLVVE